MRSRYQLGKHWQGTRLSAAMVATFLDPDARTGLDIGCNEGALTAVLGKCGLDALGVEQNDRFRERGEIIAARMNVPVRFEGRLFTVADIDAMDDVDVTLLLSVHHQIVAHHGLDHANEFLRALGRKTAMQMFFQPACILRKYKKPVPFGDNDIQAIIGYFLNLMEDIFPHRAVIGFSTNDVPKKEPLRPMLLFSHKPIMAHPGHDVIGILNELKRAKRATHPLLQAFSRTAPNG
jgi:SAM-dependent methyltransferase